jgi:hypothetical protein
MEEYKAERDEKWRKIEAGEIPDDYTNAFLSHFGFHDEPLRPSQQRSRERLLKNRNK